MECADYSLAKVLANPAGRYTCINTTKSTLKEAPPRRRMSARPSDYHNIAVTRETSDSVSAIVKESLQQGREAKQGSNVDWKTEVSDKWKLSSKRRASIIPRDKIICGNQPIDEIEDKYQSLNRCHMRKKPRRRTIYIPSDDTTIFTIHPGTCSGDAKSDGLLLHDEVPSAQGILHSHVTDSVRKPKLVYRKILAGAPRRAPPRPTLRVLPEQRENSFQGSPGKGNLPLVNSPNGMRAQTKEQDVAGNDCRKSINARSRRSQHCADQRDVSLDKGPVGYHEQRPSVFLKQVSSNAPKNALAQRRNSNYHCGAGSQIRAAKAELTPSKIVPEATLPRVTRYVRVTNRHYPLLQEDIEHASLYEDAWLNHHEIALQQLLNSILQSTSKVAPDNAGFYEARRERMLGIYHGRECTLAHKRLQASLLYGALSCPRIPRMTGRDSSRHETDLGIRRGFLHFWLNSYDLSSLAPAVEVVVGRHMQGLDEVRLDTGIVQHKLSDSSDNVNRRAVRKQRKIVEAFLETCLLCNGDAPDSDRATSTTWSWQKTVLRSLMLILLLDKAKGEGVIKCNLFRSRSAFKSSADAVAGVSRLLNPTFVGINRILGHLQYGICHVQEELSDFCFNIDNLAVDLRDGIRLCRIVELLLGFSEKVKHKTSLDPHLEGSIALTVEKGCDWSLSEKLKIPCAGRTQKLYNVQIALSALEHVNGFSSDAQTYKAEDIVDGHREMTVSLLWRLVATHGLELLIDFTELEREIVRFQKAKRLLQRKDDHNQQLHASRDGGEPESYFGFLKTWAREIAAQQCGIRVDNLTTDFANGRVFGAIVDEYRRYIPHTSVKNIDVSDNASDLVSKLLSIGCSKAFASIFGWPKDGGRVFDREFVIATLAFLCCRLLMLSRRGRAAVTILRAYRKAKMQRVILQRLTSLMLGRNCTEGVMQGTLETSEAGRKNIAAELVAKSMNICSTADEGSDIWLPQNDGARSNIRPGSRPLVPSDFCKAKLERCEVDMRVGQTAAFCAAHVVVPCKRRGV